MTSSMVDHGSRSRLPCRTAPTERYIPAIALTLVVLRSLSSVMPMKRALLALALCVATPCAPAGAQDKTDLQPLVIERPAAVGKARYELRVDVQFRRDGMVIEKVHADSPLLKMRRRGSTSDFEAERNDRITAIRDARGRFVVPQSIEIFNHICNSLPGPRTQLLIRDVRGGGSFIYDVNLVANDPNDVDGDGNADAGPAKVVVILIGDTNDENIGREVTASLSTLAEVLTRPPQAEHLRGPPVLITGDRFDRQAILDDVNAVSVERNDSLLCFVNCHGAFDPRYADYSDGHFFQLPSGTNLLRRDLRRALELKGARLTCLVTDSCNVAAPYRLGPENVVVKTQQADRNLKFESLFLEARGEVDLNSSTRGEYAWTNVFAPMFIRSLSDAADPPLEASKRTTWRQYTDELRSSIQREYAEGRRKTLQRNDLKPDVRRALQDQTTQTVRVFSLP